MRGNLRISGDGFEPFTVERNQLAVIPSASPRWTLAGDESAEIIRILPAAISLAKRLDRRRTKSCRIPSRTTMTAAIDFRPVILAGGSGTRFWPRSRRARAKQVLALDGERTMIQRTLGPADAPGQAAGRVGDHQRASFRGHLHAAGLRAGAPGGLRAGGAQYGSGVRAGGVSDRAPVPEAVLGNLPRRSRDHRRSRLRCDHPARDPAGRGGRQHGRAGH